MSLFGERFGAIMIKETANRCKRSTALNLKEGLRMIIFDQNRDVKIVLENGLDTLGTVF